MYNLLVTYARNAWDGAPYELGRDRVGEHTKKHLKELYAPLEEPALTELISFPALFAYEAVQADLPARVGKITRVRAGGTSVLIEYVIDDRFPAIPSEKWIALKWPLALDNDWEPNRTHWAIKDADLFEALADAGLIDEKLARTAMQEIPDKPLDKFDAQPIVFRLPTTPPEPDLVALMMPFSAGFGPVREIIVGACQSIGLRCLRADDVWEENEVVQDVFSLIYRSRMVICDFSERNANVMYEAGIAHTLGRPVIPLVQNDNDIPFDLRHHRYISYLNNGEGRVALAEKLIPRLRTLAGRRPARLG